jgi:DNA-binding MarR family transcriptional regulator
MDVSVATYRTLAEFRHQIRQFLHVSEQAARANGIEPQQHQLMLAIKGLPEGARPTVTTLAQRLCLKHHSAVELVNRLVERGAAVRRQSQEDRREVLVELTPFGEEVLGKLRDLHAQELQTKSPELCQALQTIVDSSLTETSKVSNRGGVMTA